MQAGFTCSLRASTQWLHTKEPFIRTDLVMWIVLSTAIPKAMLIAGEEIISIGTLITPKRPKTIKLKESALSPTQKESLKDLEIIKRIKLKTPTKAQTPVIILVLTDWASFP